MNDAFKSLIGQIFTLKDKILETECKQDFFEASGFKYSDKTFDTLFLTKFADGIDVSTESSDEPDDEAVAFSQSILNQPTAANDAFESASPDTSS